MELENGPYLYEYIFEEGIKLVNYWKNIGQQVVAHFHHQIVEHYYYLLMFILVPMNNCNS